MCGGVRACVTTNQCVCVREDQCVHLTRVSVKCVSMCVSQGVSVPSVQWGTVRQMGALPWALMGCAEYTYIPWNVNVTEPDRASQLIAGER